MSSSYRGGAPSQRRTTAMPTTNSVMYGGRPRSLGLYSGGTNTSLTSLLAGAGLLGHSGPSYLTAAGSPTSYMSSSPKGTALYLSSSPKTTASYLSSSPKTAASYLSNSPKSTASYLSSSPKYSSSPKSTSSLLLSSTYNPGSSLSLSTYGGTSSGYGGLTLSALAPHRKPGKRSSSATRSSSFNLRNSRGPTTGASPVSSTLSSRSGSWASLAPSSSEGYISGSDWPSQSSRLSNSPSGDGRPVTPAARGSKEVSNENGEIDYKKLYEVTVAENERLKDLYETTLAGNERLKEQLKKTESDLHEAKSQLEKLPIGTMKNSLSEIEKRERRAMERKLSEMEEELKQLQKLKAENERLKAENRALTRVVSKLTNSANATK